MPGFAASGSNQPSIDLYRDWAAHPMGLLVLGVNSLGLFTHFGLALAGFGLTVRELWRAAR